VAAVADDDDHLCHYHFAEMEEKRELTHTARA